MELIVTTPEQLARVVNEAIYRALNCRPQIQQPSDRCTLKDALEITGLSKSKLYKLTSTKEIPFKTYGNRLIFSRKELEVWVQDQTIDKAVSSEASLTLAKSARRKQRRG